MDVASSRNTPKEGSVASPLHLAVSALMAAGMLAAGWFWEDSHPGAILAAGTATIVFAVILTPQGRLAGIAEKLYGAVAVTAGIPTLIALHDFVQAVLKI